MYKFGFRQMLLVVVAASVMPFVVNFAEPGVQFSQDSWAYYDLAQTTFVDFYRSFVHRSYGEGLGYNQSFPPLWPVVVAVGLVVAPFGVTTQILLAVISAIATIIPLRSIARTCQTNRSVADVSALLIWISLITFGGYASEVLAGRSIPLAILIQLSAFALLLQGGPDLKPSRSGAAGLLLGLGALTRFDALPIALAVAAYFAVTSRVRLTARLALVLGVAIGLAPWIVYSELRFGRLWASDTSFMALSAVPTTFRAYDPSVSTVFTDPGRWVIRIAKNAASLWLAFLSALPTFPLLVVSIAAAGVVFRAPAGRGTTRQLTRDEKGLGALIAVAVVGLAGQVLVGYIDTRYFTLLFLVLTAFAVCYTLRRSTRVRSILWGAAFYTLAVALAQSALFALERTRLPALLSDTDIALLRREMPNAVILDGPRFCSELGARARVHVVCLPSDWAALTDEKRRDFVGRLGITHVRFPPPGDAETRVFLRRVSEIDDVALRNLTSRSR